MSVEGHQSKDGEDMQAFMNAVSPGYFQTLGAALIEGRDFDRRDEVPRAHAADRLGDSFRTAIVNRKFATHFFGNKSPIGRHVGFGDGPSSKRDIEIIGVTEDCLYEGPREGVHRQAFVPLAAGDLPSSAVFYIRTSLDSASMFASVRRTVQQIDHDLPVYEMKTLANQLDETLNSERLIAALSTAFGILATLLAAIGLYGVMAFSVARRTKEIGLRMALGAQRGVVVWMVLRESLLLLGIGLLAGVPVALALSHYVSAQLFGVKANDVWTVLSALGVLAAVAAGAGLLPARRASAIDPIQALRYE
jgi:predicted permease